ncbi:MAG: glycosyltransferase [Saccharospirillum sp.]|nr:glycosyltransferase [Saccharospirillum sp.]
MSLHVLILPSWYAKDSKDTKGSFFKSQAAALARSGAKVGILYPHIDYTSSFRHLLGRRGKTEQFHNEGFQVFRQINCHFIRGSARQHAARLRKYGLELFERYITENGMPDIIHVHSVLYAGLIALDLKEKYGIPYVITEHATAYSRGKVRPRKMALATSVIDEASAHSVVSSAFSRLMTRFFPKVKWQVLPNVVDEAFLNVELKEQNPAHFNFLAVCYFSERKGLDTLISAFAVVANLHPTARLTLSGDGDVRSKLEQQVADLGLTEKVRFTGLLSREQVLSEMQNCHCYVLSSHYETFGVVLIEALALGKPVVATRCEGPEDIVDDSNGILVPVGDVQAMSEAMVSMIQDHERFSPQQLRDQCKERFGPVAIANRLQGMYSQVLNEG